MSRSQTALLLLPLILFGSAAAQTRIGNIILTPAGQTAPKGKSVSAAVPTGMREISGRVSAGGTVRLPAGSKVTVTVQEYNTRNMNTVVNVTFGTTKLDTPYQVYFNPVRINEGRRYAIRATVRDASGNTLYVTDPVLEIPRAQKATLTLRVRPVN